MRMSEVSFSDPQFSRQITEKFSVHSSQGADPNWIPDDYQGPPSELKQEKRRQTSGMRRSSENQRREEGPGMSRFQEKQEQKDQCYCHGRPLEEHFKELTINQRVRGDKMSLNDLGSIKVDKARNEASSF